MPRDPLSEQYDPLARRYLARAAKASAYKGNVHVFVVSPAAEFRKRDRGGLTRHERAFKRAMYYPVWREPLNAHVPQVWSLAVDLMNPRRARSRRGALAREFRITLRPKSQGKVTKARSWVDNPELRAAPGRVGG